MSMLAENKCYILLYCQGTDPCGAVRYFTKYSLTAIPLTLPFFFRQALHFPGDIHTKCRPTEYHNFPYIIVQNAACFNDVYTKVRFYVN